MREMTQTYAQELFEYNPETGSLIWLSRPIEHFNDRSYWLRWNQRYPGKHAGNLGNVGYFRVNIQNRFYTVHRLIFLIVTGKWPDTVDHINGVTTDNRWANLRSVTHTENTRNARRPTTNTSGQVGVSYCDRDKRWQAYIGVGAGRRQTLGNFHTREEAIAARRAAEIVLDYHENHGRAA